MNNSVYNNTHDNNISNNLQNSTEVTVNNNSPIYRAPKRTRDSIPNSLFEYTLKTPRLSSNDSPFKLLNLIDKRFEKMTDFIQTMFNESESRIEKILDQRFNELKSDIININERVTKLETVAGEIISLKTEVQTLKAQMQRQENSVVATDLRINGIPADKNEDLLKIFKSICELISINTPAVKSIYRLQNYNNSNNAFSPEAVIMVKLFSSYDKNFVLKALSKFRKDIRSPLMLHHIGLGSERPFYVNENLTLCNHKILQSASRLKKIKKLQSVFTIRGLVYVKLGIEKKPVRVEFLHELDDLDNLFRAENPNILK